MSESDSTPDLPAELTQEEDGEEEGQEGAVDPGDQQEAAVVLERPAGRGQHQRTNSPAGAGLGGEEEGEVAAGEGRQDQEGGED